MNNQLEKKIIAALENYAPQPGQQFDLRMANAPWKRPQRSAQNRFFHRLSVGLASALLVIIVLSLSLTPVRAAVLGYLGLGISASNTVPNPAIPVSSLVDSQKVGEISQLAGWVVKAPNWLPAGYHFEDVTYDSSNKMVILTFLATRQLPGNDPSMTETKAITLVEALHNDIIPLMVAPGTAVQDITVADQAAAYAVGAWENDAATGKATWNDSYSLQNVYWQIGKVYLNLNTDDAQVSQAELIRLADSTK